MISKKTDSDNSKKSEDDESKCFESKEVSIASKENKEDIAKNSSTPHTQWSPKDKRDNSCPGNVETGGSQKEETKMPSRSLTNSTKSVTGDESSEKNENSKNDNSNVECQNKDPRVERRIRNKVCIFFMSYSVNLSSYDFFFVKILTSSIFKSSLINIL